MFFNSRLFNRATTLAAGAFVSILVSAAPAHAVCTPNAGDNVTATCTGTTNGQNGADGYGSGYENNLNTTVVQGATVTGTGIGINFWTGSVINSGAITGFSDGVKANASGTVTNFGTITGRDFAGIFAGTSVAVTNSGAITGGFLGLFIEAGSTSLTNSGTITGGNAGIYGNKGGVTATNSGLITGGFYGILANGSVAVINSGTITGTHGFGIIAVNDATVTNSGSITGGLGAGIATASSATVTNTGTILGGFAGISAGTSASVTNYGTITAHNLGIETGTDALVTNSGTITATGPGAGILALGSANVINSGTITGSLNGITAGTSATVTNSGTIVTTGASGIGISVGTTGNITNSGTIIGTGGTAIQFNAKGTPGSDSLTVLPGARFGGKVDFGGGADKVNFGPGSWILNTANFNAGLSTVTTSGSPYFVTASQIVVADVSGFGAQNRAITDITGWISSVLPDAPVFAPAAAAGGANAFAVDSAASPFDAVASFPPDALGYAATKAPVFKGGAATYADGNVVWAKGFGGQRQQDTVGAFVGSTTTGYGGAVGYERLINPDIKIGALIGASSSNTNLDQNAGSANTDTVFGGAYSRLLRGSTFLDLAVIGGNLDNSSARNNIAGGLAAQTATASYGGWFVDPSLMAGHRIDVDGRGFTVTPAVKLRYVAAHFDGYTESGSTANLTVGGRDYQAIEERAELTFANTGMIGTNRVTTRVTGGILGQQRTSGSQLNIALLGENFIAATPDRGSIAGGYGSAGLDWQIGRVTLFAAGEAAWANDATRIYAGKGGVRVGW